MMLRASVEATGGEIDLNAAINGTGESGVEHGDLLGQFAAALVRREPGLADLRERVRAAVGEEGLAEVSGVTGNFQRMVRIADGTGIPIEPRKAAATVDLREQLNINRFDRSAQLLGS